MNGRFLSLREVRALARLDVPYDVLIDACHGRHVPEWNDAEGRWDCARGCGPLDLRRRGELPRARPVVGSS